jgi:acetaldehyde dehydrogenase
VTCGGQATIPVVAAITRVVDVPYAEIVASISSRSAGPGTRANIDEFTEVTAHAIRTVGGAQHAKAIIVLNPAEPPVIMRATVLALVDDPGGQRQPAIRDSIERMVSQVAAYVPGYRLKQDVQFTVVPPDEPVQTLTGASLVSHQVSVFLEVEGAGHYLPAHAGNLDIMTSAAVHVAEQIAARAGSARTPAGVPS